MVVICSGGGGDSSGVGGDIKNGINYFFYLIYSPTKLRFKIVDPNKLKNIKNFHFTKYKKILF